MRGDVREFLTGMDAAMNAFRLGYSAKSLERVVLTRAVQYEPMVLTSPERAKALYARWHVSPRLKDCFRVATIATDLLLSEGADVQYVEGYATSGMLAVHHAWFTLNGKVIDLTWRRTKSGKGDIRHGQQFVLGQYPDEWDYFGIPIPFDLVRASMVRTGYYGYLTDRHNVEALDTAPTQPSVTV